MALAPALDLRKDSMPASVEAEQALLGVALSDNRAVEAGEMVRPEHFYEPLHGRIWAAILERMTKGVADVTLVAERFISADDTAFKMLGGVRYLADLVDKAPASRMAGEYAEMIVDLAKRRDLIRIGGEMGAAARLGEQDSPELIASAEAALSDLAHEGGASAWVSAGAVVANAVARAKNTKGLPGLTTGLKDLDAATGGLRSGVLTTLAARPGMGKSTAALQIVKACASASRGALMFSMEMPEFDLGVRMACDLAHDPYAPFYSGKKDNPRYFDAARGDLPGDHWRRLDDAVETVRSWPIDFDPRPGLKVSQMLAASRRRFRQWERAGIEPGLIVLDHLTIARPDQDRKGNKVAEVGDISRGLAEMAKTLGVPVVALCQLSRDVEKRLGNDRRPNLSDLRWSGEIEQDSRLVMFLYRPEYYARRPEDPDDFEAMTEWRAKLDKHRNKLFWYIEKNNNGPTAEVETYCDIACSAIRDRLGGGDAPFMERAG